MMKQLMLLSVEESEVEILSQADCSRSEFETCSEVTQCQET
jgi:hypothetical protein